MRQDMKKVIVERPRVGGCSRDHKPRIDEDSHNHESMKANLGWWTKEHSDLIGPLIRFLRSRVGRKWDSVWSEICKYNKDYMGRHLKDHVGYLVELLCYKEDGKIYDSQNNLVKYSWRAFYVCDGILYKTPRRDIVKKDEDINYVYLDNTHYYKFNDLWYRVYMKEWKKEKRTLKTSTAINNELKTQMITEYYFYDIFHNHCKSKNPELVEEKLIRLYGGVYYPCGKESASKKEIRKIKKLIE